MTLRLTSVGAVVTDGPLVQHRRRSSVVERLLGKGEVVGSNPIGGLSSGSQDASPLERIRERDCGFVAVPGSKVSTGSELDPHDGSSEWLRKNSSGVSRTSTSEPLVTLTTVRPLSLRSAAVRHRFQKVRPRRSIKSTTRRKKTVVSPSRLLTKST